MKMIILMSCVFAALAACTKKDKVEKTASDAIVAEALSQPDGVCLVRNESDGSLQVFARGTASYYIGDARDIRRKTKVAELQAKAELSKFFKEKVIVEQSKDDEWVSQMSDVILTGTGNGEVKKKAITSGDLEAMRETILIRSEAILSGLVTLKTVKVPAKGSATSGDIQVTLGMSTKTLAATTEAYNMITDSMNARRVIGEKIDTPKQPVVNKGNVDANQGAPEVRIGNTLF